MHDTITTKRELIYKMLTTSTGRAILDSGDYYGRNWERNAKKTIEDFINEPEATLEIEERGDTLEPSVTISLFHYLDNALELDGLCDQFNAMPCDNWESDIYGVSSEGKQFLDDRDATIKGDYNSSNWDSSLSQVIQYTLIDIDGTDYVLLQVHGGCDVRGGYTDAKLFKIIDECYLYENASFCLFRGDHRLGIDLRGNDLEVYNSDWSDDNIDLEGALKEFGVGTHEGELQG